MDPVRPVGNGDELKAVQRSLAKANAEAAEVVAELELRSAQLERANENLARANARSAELVAELQARREELEWANTNLKQAGEENKRILGIAAHDLRSGVGGIRNLAEILVDAAGAGGPEISEPAALIHRQSCHLLELLDDLIDETRAQMGKLELRPTSVRLRELIDEAVGFRRPTACAKSQSIEIRQRGEIPAFDADPIRVRQVLDNLLSNAIKYSPHGSAIVISVWVEGARVGISVEDQGPGLTEDDLARVFGEFARLSAKPTGGESSHGLGLAIVKRIVGLHGGRIWAENRPGNSGARFAFTLPIWRGESAAMERAA